MKRRTFQPDAAGRLDDAIARALSVTVQEAASLVERGAVYVGGRRARDAKSRVEAGAPVAVVLEEGGRPVTEHAAPPPSLVVLYEDDDVIAVDKPAGVTAQPTPGRAGDSLVDLVSARLGHEAGLVHRLDKETSGVTVFGKRAPATTRLAAAFREGRAKKQYLALTSAGLPAEGLITLPLSKDPSRPGRWRASAKANGVPAQTRFVRLAEGPLSLVHLFPQTGRTHQLRAHLAGIGHPIVGDRLYGGAPAARCLLHAWKLEVDGLALVAPLPADLAEAISLAFPGRAVIPN
ncbi:MAG: RluA family pseudouridine synthase [Myxococcota bacterium]